MPHRGAMERDTMDDKPALRMADDHDHTYRYYDADTKQYVYTGLNDGHEHRLAHPRGDIYRHADTD